LADGTLYPTNYLLNDGSQAAVLDVIQVGFQSSRPSAHHPEDWVVDRTQWRLVGRPVQADMAGVLKSAITVDAELLLGYEDRIPCDHLLKHPIRRSLTLAAPDEAELYHQLSYSGRPQVRCRFRLGAGRRKTLYDLVVTDPAFDSHALPNDRVMTKQVESPFLLTVSLSEPFGRYCFKLVAAIITLPHALSESIG